MNRNGECGHWHPGTIHTLIKNPIYIGEVWVNRTRMITNAKSGKRNSTIRPREEWSLLPDGTAPALIDRDTFEKIQIQLTINKEEAARNNAHPKEEYGLLRGGYCLCGICGCRMRVHYPGVAAAKTRTNPWYYCHKLGGASEGRYKHRVQIHVPMVDRAVHEKIVEVLQHPDWIRERVAELYAAIPQPPPINEADIAETVANIGKQMQNLLHLAQYATSDDTMAELELRLQGLEKQKREAEGLLYDASDDEKQQQLLEQEIVKFERWVALVRPNLTDPSYRPSYEELRLAVRIIGITVTVYPNGPEYLCRYRIDAAVPEVMKKLLLTRVVDKY